MPPIAVPIPDIQTRSLKLVDAWSDLITDTSANLQNIVNNADPTAIVGAFSALLTNPLGVIESFTDLTPTVTGSLPDGLTAELPPGLEIAIAQLGAEATTLNAINEVVAQLAANPSGALSTLFEAPAVIANGYLNGEDNISLLNGIVDFTGFNGVLAPVQDLAVHLNLTSLIDALGVSDLSLSHLDLSALLSQLGLGNLDISGLFNALGLSNEGLGNLLTDPTLSSVLGDLGLGNLGLGSFSLTNLLNDLNLNPDLGPISLTNLLNGLDLNQDLGSLSLTNVLSDLGLNPTLGPVSLTNLLNGLDLNQDLGSLSLNRWDYRVNGVSGGFHQ